EPIVFEIVATHERITTQFVCAEADYPLVRHQLEAHFPEAVFTRESSLLEQAWKDKETEETVVLEFGLTREFMFQLAAPRNPASDPYIPLIAALSNLHAG